MNEIEKLVQISKYAGERFDLVQAGGGNSSVKFDNGEMIIKASGFLLSDVNNNGGFAKVKTQEIANIVKNDEVINATTKREREKLTALLVKNATLTQNDRPSIETLLHSFLLKYTLHTHPIVVNMVVVQKNWKTLLSEIFSDMDIAFVEYQTPGIELALSLYKVIPKKENISQIIFLQNHGLIVTSDNQDEIQTLTELVLEKIEKYLNLNMQRYKETNLVSSLINTLSNQNSSTYLSEDSYLNQELLVNGSLFESSPFCPDSLVYCGISCCEISNLSDLDSLKAYKEKYFELPKVIRCGKRLFFNAINIKKAKEMEEVFKFHIMVLSANTQNDLNFLALDELAYLSNWEAEQYRQKI